jgi:ADP-ribosylglycohydrolase
MMSDDTEHTVMVAQSLVEHPADVAAFQRKLARRLRWWLLRLPAGVGLATARACLKLWLGFPPSRSGVHSAGNGPAMRSAVIGVFFARDARRRTEFVRASTRLTHTDPRAEVAAQAVAVAAAHAVQPTESQDALFTELAGLSDDDEWQSILREMQFALRDQRTVAEFASLRGLTRGVTGYAYHAVPVALYGWLRHGGDFEATLTAVLSCGGDTDTVGAITGAPVGAGGGAATIPARWLDGIRDWPCNVAFLRQLAGQLQDAGNGEGRRSLGLSWAALLLRNAFFLVVVLVHGFGRLLPFPERAKGEDRS